MPHISFEPLILCSCNKIDLERGLKNFFLLRDMVLTFVNSLVPTVRRALCDQTPEVRAAAAKTFDSLHNTVGSRYDFFLSRSDVGSYLKLSGQVLI